MADSQYLDDAFREICEELVQTFLKKHRDYGKGNILEIGEMGISYRIAEKVSRLKNLLQKSDSPENEPIDDSWTDIAVYAILAKLHRSGKFQKLEVNPKNK
ncbi:MAG: hypothetical protein UX04_C0006G0061 [Microgenomates group bacterium GW2011_GWF2_45_18]|nr:MAG: hypothetical protein UW18_C0006G0061 [Microgenomates group bacterium GW2011_GWF1_44_10]KKU01526.1 MAG: hypothetical protein UX04_C0006G0061 [Microgenomates group bacterium GW2011_GWF2_45_18]OGJ41425.1 MAG: hypothetical protein A2378_00175 [Candidatus Pacebacteria bacterium RIFOXYB1_FULL_44_10]HAU99434.1 hypothetical protein [Candidatus Paceibacterota bacterium]HAX01560.1 hypothetical protein [Candidatus Paceibacterota bacterium]